MKKLATHWDILIAILLAIILGQLIGLVGGAFHVVMCEIFDFVGKLFLSALKMLIVPLIFSSMVVGISNIGSGHQLGMLSRKTLIIYCISSILAVSVGVVFVNITLPGIIDGEPAGKLFSNFFKHRS